MVNCDHKYNSCLYDIKEWFCKNTLLNGIIELADFRLIWKSEEQEIHKIPQKHEYTILFIFGLFELKVEHIKALNSLWLDPGFVFHCFLYWISIVVVVVEGATKNFRIDWRCVVVVVVA